MSNDTKLTMGEMKKMVEEIEKQGWPQAVEELFSQEPALAEHITGEFDRVRAKVCRSCFEGASERLCPMLAKLVVEPLLLLDRSHRRMWDGFMPTEQMESRPTPAAAPLTAALPPRRKTFAKVEYDAKHVQMFRPDLSEFQARLFLMFREVEIGSAAYDAGLAAIEKLSKGFREGRKS